MEQAINNLNYVCYIADMSIEQAKIQRYLDECVLIGLNEATYDNLQSIQEGFADKLKNGLHKIWTAIVGMWNKFVEGIVTLFASDKKWLEKYKDIILKKNPVNGLEYIMYPYKKGIPIMMKATVPAFNLQQMFDSLDTEENFQTKYFNSYWKDKKMKFEDAVKECFRGGDKEERISIKTENLTDMYNYCINCKSMVDGIQKDIDKLERTCEDAKKQVESLARNNEIAARKEEPQNDNSPDNNQPQPQNNSAVLSVVTGRLIHELEKVDKDNPTGSSSSNVSKANSNIGGKGAELKDQDIKDLKQDAEEVSKRISLYLRVCANFLGAKMAVAKVIYKEYMQILKDHVRSHLGDDKKDKSKNKPKDKASEYDANDTGRDEDGNETQTQQDQSNQKDNSGKRSWKDVFRDILSGKNKK